MSIQSTPWIPLSADDRYRGLDTLIISYCGRGEVQALANPESPVAHLPVIAAATRRFTQEDQACLDEGFHPVLVTSFRNNGLSLWRLPVIDLGDKTRTTGYIDFLGIEDMHGASVVRFKDALKRPGVALHLKGNIEGEVCFWREQIPIREVEGVLAIFKRCTPRENMLWVYGGMVANIEAVYKKYVLNQIIDFTKQVLEGRGFTSALCDLVSEYLDEFNDTWDAANELFNIGICLQFADRIISGTDPAFVAMGEVPQIEQPLPEKPQADGPKKETAV